MSGSEWAALIAALVPVFALIGGGFGWLIKMIVDQSKTAVKELRETNERAMAKMEAERDTWRERALESGWKGDR